MFRSGFVALLGRPNMGKSTLLNALVGQKIAITSPVAQTTRHRIKGVVSVKEGKTDIAKGQIIFLDTPGFSKPLDQLGTYLTDEGKAALSDADCLMVVMDLSQAPGSGDEWVAQQAMATGKFILLCLNKYDLIAQNAAKRQQHLTGYQHIFQGYEAMNTLMVSAKSGKNLGKIPDMLLRKMPAGPAYYDEETPTDQRLREISAELIREQVLHSTRDEIPHSVAIGIERFAENVPDKNNTMMTHIDATLYVDQTSQKGMLIGKDGQQIKKIGAQARQEIETLLDQPVYLRLNVKVKKNWRKDEAFLKGLGLAPPEKTPSP